MEAYPIASILKATGLPVTPVYSTVRYVTRSRPAPSGNCTVVALSSLSSFWGAPPLLPPRPSRHPATGGRQQQQACRSTSAVR